MNHFQNKSSNSQHKLSSENSQLKTKLSKKRPPRNGLVGEKCVNSSELIIFASKLGKTDKTYQVRTPSKDIN